MNVPPVPAMPVPAMPVPPRAPGPGLALSISAIVLGVVVGIVSGILILIPVFGAIFSPVYAVPGEIHMHLHRSRYTVFQRWETRSRFGSTIDPSSIPIDPASVSVIGPGGVEVPVTYDADRERINRGSADFLGSLAFRAPTGGEYTLRFNNTNPTTVIVGRSIPDIVRSVAWCLLTGALGAALCIGGIVMLAVGMTRRGRLKRATQMGWGNVGWGVPPPYGPPGPGWGPPPPGGPPNDPWAPRG